MKYKIAAGASILFIIVLATYLFILQFVPQSYLDVRKCQTSYNATTEQNIFLMRENLDSIVRHFPNQELNGFVLFNQGIPIEQYIKLIKKYNVHMSGQQPPYAFDSIQFVATRHSPVYGIEKIGIAEKMKPDFFEIESFYKWSLNQKEKIDPDSVAINSFWANTTAKEFLALWDENKGVVRGIGIGCTAPRYVPNPRDPIKLSVVPSALSLAILNF